MHATEIHQPATMPAGRISAVPYSLPSAEQMQNDLGLPLHYCVPLTPIRAFTIFSKNSRGEAVGKAVLEERPSCCKEALWYYHPETGFQIIADINFVIDTHASWTSQLEPSRPRTYDLPNVAIGESGVVAGTTFAYIMPPYWLDEDDWELIQTGPAITGYNYFLWDKTRGVYYASPVKIQEGDHLCSVSFSDKDQVQITVDGGPMQTIE